MRRRRWTRGVLLAVLFASSTVLLGGCSVQDAEKHLRFGFPTGVTKQAERMRVLWSWAGVAALALGVIVWGLMFWCALRYRKKSDRLPRQTKYNLLIEIVCVTFPFLVIIALFWRTVVVENYVNNFSKNADVVVRVDAFKWNWQFEYLSTRGNGGKQVVTSYPGQRDLTGGTPGPLFLSTVGTDTEIPILVIPVGESVQIFEHSEDVVHSFWVPEFLFKRDVIPYGTLGQEKKSKLQDNHFQITPTSTGAYVGRCAELCGTYHSQMNFEVRVVSPSVFQRYLAALKQIGPNDPARQSKALTAAKVPGGPFAVTTHPFDTERTSRQPGS